MSGTIVIDPQTSVDVRTVDFLRIVEAVRAEKNTSHAAIRLLESVDDFGMNMICADELDAADLADFVEILRKLQANTRSDESGFHRFVADLSNLIAQDERLRQSPDGHGNI
jgi:hypothetical protein